jgi:hypothetical protein
LFEATKSGHLENFQWVFTEFKDQINWNEVIEYSCRDWHSHKVIDYLESNVSVTLAPETVLYRLAAKGDLAGLQAASSKSPDNFPWQDVADGAARGGHADIVQRVYEQSVALPKSSAVEAACEMGDFSVLRCVYELDSTRIAPGSSENDSNALRCILCAAMHNKPEEMEWIWCNPLENALPSVIP